MYFQVATRQFLKRELHVNWQWTWKEGRFFLGLQIPSVLLAAPNFVYLGIIASFDLRFLPSHNANKDNAGKASKESTEAITSLNSRQTAITEVTKIMKMHFILHRTVKANNELQLRILIRENKVADFFSDFHSLLLCGRPKNRFFQSDSYSFDHKTRNV